MNPAVSLDSRLRLAAAVAAAAFALGGCYSDPKMNMPDASVIHVNPDGSSRVDCRSLTESPILSDGGFGRPDMQWGCATYSNLAAQVADPRDLVAPSKLDPANGPAAVTAVRRYELGNVKALDRAVSTSDTKEAPGGGTNGATAGGAP